MELLNTNYVNIHLQTIIYQNNVELSSDISFMQNSYLDYDGGADTVEKEETRAERDRAD